MYAPDHNFGSVIEGDSVRYFSVSGLKRGDEETEAGCARKWWFRYKARIPDPSGPAAELGTECHTLAAHYLTTGEQVLNTIMRAGRHLMPNPSPSLLVEHTSFGDIHVDGVPMLLKIDVLNDGQYYKTTDGDDGLMTKGMVEVIDHKTTKNFRFVKTGPQLGNDLQMLGYGALAASLPGVTSVRLSHIYYKTEGAPDACKTTIVLSADELRARFVRLERVAALLKQVAKAEHPEQVKANRGACDLMKGCAYKGLCPKTSDEHIADVMKALKPR